MPPKKQIAVAVVVVEPVISSSDDDLDANTGKQGRHVLTPLERTDMIIAKLQESGITAEVKSQLERLRRQLDGAKIKQAHSSRPPNEYNLWMKAKMAELKESSMTPKERFAQCIRLWNDNKVSVAAAATADP
jgi:aminopeptidase C